MKKCFLFASILSVVLIAGVIDTVEAEITDHLSITEVAEVQGDQLLSEIESKITFYKPGMEYEAMQSGHSNQVYEGDIDYQVISLQAKANVSECFVKHVPYRPRSNLNYLSNLA